MKWDTSVPTAVELLVSSRDLACQQELGCRKSSNLGRLISLPLRGDRQACPFAPRQRGEYCSSSWTGRACYVRETCASAWEFDLFAAAGFWRISTSWTVPFCPRVCICVSLVVDALVQRPRDPSLSKDAGWRGRRRHSAVAAVSDSEPALA